MNIISKIQDYSVAISPEWSKRIDELLYSGFVNRMTDANQSVRYYVIKRNASYQKAKEDIFVSKKTEYLTLVGLVKLFNFPQIKLDLEVRNGGSKGWAHDLPFNDVDARFPNVHVKACTDMTLRYCSDYSWTFQYSNNDWKGGKDSIFNTKANDLVVLIHLPNPESNKATIKAILPTRKLLTINNGNFEYLRDPVKKTLVGLKKCVYYEDLLKNKQEIENLEICLQGIN